MKQKNNAHHFEIQLPPTYDPTHAKLPYTTAPTGQTCTAILGAMTKAMQAEKALLEASIRATVTKVSSSAHASGCVYGVAYACNQDSIVREVLSSAGIRVRGYLS